MNPDRASEASTQALRSNLREALFEFRRKRSHLSLRAIARYSGVNRYFLSKLLDESDESSSLDLNQVVLLSKYITSRNSIREALEATSQDFQDILRQILNPEYLSQKDIALNLKDLNLYDKDTYFTLVLSSYAHGTSRSCISRVLGERGEFMLEKLLKKGILLEKEGRIKLAKGNEFTLSTDVLRQHIPRYLDFYSCDRNFQQKNFIHVYSEGLTRTAIKKIYELHQTLNREIQAIISETEHHGDIPFFSFACMDQILESDT